MRAVLGWVIESQLQCNPNKTEIILLGPYPNPGWNDACPKDGPPSILAPINLGAISYNVLSLKTQIHSVATNFTWILKALKKFLPLLQWEACKTVVQATILSQLDYVNALYLGLTAYLFL